MPLSPQQTQEFVALLTRNQEVVRCYIISMLPTLTDVADIQQEVNIFLWEKKEEFEMGTSFGAWACTIAYYKVLEYRRKLKKDGILVFNDTLLDLLNEDYAEQPESVTKKRLALNQCLQSLDDKERTLLLARYESASNPMEQISRATGRTKASLRVTFSRMRSKLRNCITVRLSQEGGAV